MQIHRGSSQIFRIKARALPVAPPPGIPLASPPPVAPFLLEPEEEPPPPTGAAPRALLSGRVVVGVGTRSERCRGKAPVGRARGSPIW